MPDDRNDSQAYKRARKRVEELRDFYSHLAVYLLVNLGLFMINMATNRQVLWFFWPLIGWGLAVLIHGTTVLLEGPFGQRWEERKTRQLMEKERSRWQPPRPHAP